MKFIIGDRVKYVSGEHGDSEYNPLWNGRYGKIIGTIIQEQPSGMNYRVEWDSNRQNSYYTSDLKTIYIVPEELFKI